MLTLVLFHSYKICKTHIYRTHRLFTAASVGFIVRIVVSFALLAIEYMHH